MGVLFTIAIGFGFGYATYRHAPYMIVGGSGWVPLVAVLLAGGTCFLSGRRLGQRQYQWQQQQQAQAQEQVQAQSQQVVVQVLDGERAPGGPAERGEGTAIATARHAQLPRGDEASPLGVTADAVVLEPSADRPDRFSSVSTDQPRPPPSPPP